MKIRCIALLCALLGAFALAAQEEPQFTMTPRSGPTAGGTEVTITGEFGEWPYGVYFGSTPALETRRVNEHTLVARTPPHLPGVSEVRIFEYDIFLATGLTFTFEGDVPEGAFERVLLPSFTPPVRGAFGSEFHSRFRAAAMRNWVQLFGIEEVCPIEQCTERDLNDYAVTVGTADTLLFEPNGTPGRFLFVRQPEVANLAANLRVFDVTRAGLNFGTEIPVVRESDFRERRLLLLGVPGDVRFRNTLRIYAVRPMTVNVLVNGAVHRNIALIPGSDIFEPAYAQIGDLPSGDDMTIAIEESGPTDGPATPFWALVTVTNNETQVITTISPAP